MLIPYRIRLWVSEQWTLSPGYRGVCLSVCIYVNSLQNTTAGARTVDTVTRSRWSTCVCPSICLSVRLYLCSFLTEYDCGCQNSGHCHQVTGECVCLSVCIYVNSLQNTTVGVRTVDTVTRLQGSVSVCLSVFMLIPYRIRLRVSEQWTLSPGYRGVCLSVWLYLCSFLTEYDCGCRNSGHCHQVTGECVCLSVFMFIPYRIRLWVSEQWTLSPGYRGVCLSVCLSVFMLIPYRIRLRVSEQWTLSPGYRGVCVSVCLYLC